MFEDYKWHYDYVRLAWDTGFTFERYKSLSIENSKIYIVDIEKIIKERDVASVDRHISTVIQYILDEEQSKLLDYNFVKIFRLSQLAVEYLLFCKKYLDNTVALLKKELTKNAEENRELKTLLNELQERFAAVNLQQSQASFKCSFCIKTFSSDEYLKAHIQRRHSTTNIVTSETEKLNMEIKELKERLNGAERLLKEKNEEVPEKWKSNEVIENVEKLKNQIETEIKELKLQKTFYEQNYEKLMSLIVENKENMEPTKGNIKVESTTQTSAMLQAENIKNKSVVDASESPKHPTETESTLHPMDSNINKTLDDIKEQMQTFWNKLMEMQEFPKKTEYLNIESQGNSSSLKINENRPMPKPRSKLSHSNRIKNNDREDSEKIKILVEELQQQKEINEELRKNSIPKIYQDKVTQSPLKKPSFEMKNSLENDDLNEKNQIHEDSSTEESSEESSSSQLSLPDTKSPNKTKKNKNEKNSVGNTFKIPEKNFNEEIEEKVENLLQELGISKTWTRLPNRSRDKALEIINHQASSLITKMYPNFSNIRKNLALKIDKMCKSKCDNQLKQSPKIKASKPSQLQNVIKISYKHKRDNIPIRNSAISTRSKEMLEIKNREIFNTDSSEEESPKVAGKNRIDSPKSEIYSSQISDDNSVHEENQRNNKTGVTNNYPSLGSLNKKKVFFDLASESDQKQDCPNIQKTEGSTTSIASSILEDKIEIWKNIKNGDISKQIVEDLSDFDISNA
ncbi:hypothetical protein ABEB36_008018 [Hypothenemus hampei]